VAALISLSTLVAACNPEAGPPSPRNPGSIVATVLDDGGFPIPDVRMEVELPNAIGSVFRMGTRTNPDGVATLRGVPEGTRQVIVTPPTGFSIAVDERAHLVDVGHNRSVSITFVLKRTLSI
jgi:hypothetical protein